MAVPCRVARLTAEPLLEEQLEFFTAWAQVLGVERAQGRVLGDGAIEVIDHRFNGFATADPLEQRF